MKTVPSPTPIVSGITDIAGCEAAQLARCARQRGRSLMSDDARLLKHRVAAAAQWRTENQEMADRGWVLFYREVVCGWASELNKPQDWCPGCVAVGIKGCDGPIYVATGGNDDAGAAEWSLCWNPTPNLAVERGYWKDDTGPKFPTSAKMLRAEIKT